MIRCLIVLFLIWCVLAARCQYKSSKQLHKFKNGIVSSAHPLASQAGIDILQQGGNAFDAAVAVAAALNVVEPMMSGMGGYGTILTYDAKEKRIRFLDSSGKIPVNMDSDLMRPPTPDYESNRRGAKSISTPGNVNAWAALSDQYGNLEWVDLFKPAIDIARGGFLVSQRLALFLEYSFEEFPEHAKEIYGGETAPLTEGDRLIQADLASTFSLLSQKGPDWFYKAELCDIIIAAMEEHGSFLSKQDLQEDKAEWWDPISIDYKGYEVFTASPPANSFPALIRLGMMKQFEQMDHNSADYLHSYAEVTKHAFWCRLRYAGDPEIAPPPLDKLLSPKYWQEQSSQIEKNKASEFLPPNFTAELGPNTTHFVVADQWGNIVTATQTLGNLFGSKIMPEGTGIWMNNSLAYCTYEPKGNPMDAIPGQRKLSGDCPVIIMKGERPWAALGTPGGHTIPQTVPQMIMNMIDFEMDIDAAIQAPRISFIEPNSLAVESLIPNEVIDELKKRGHKVLPSKGRVLGNAHGISLFYNDTGNLIAFSGGADERGEGAVIGY